MKPEEIKSLYETQPGLLLETIVQDNPNEVVMNLWVKYHQPCNLDSKSIIDAIKTLVSQSPDSAKEILLQILAVPVEGNISQPEMQAVAMKHSEWAIAYPPDGIWKTGDIDPLDIEIANLLNSSGSGQGSTSGGDGTSFNWAAFLGSGALQGLLGFFGIGASPGGGNASDAAAIAAVQAEMERERTRRTRMWIVGGIVSVILLLAGAYIIKKK